jgi:S1-C subfamily serine protease
MNPSAFLFAVLAFLALSGTGINRLLANDVYDQVTPSSVLIYASITDAQKGLTYQSVGSGVLIDAEKKLVATAEHVVHPAIRAGSFKTAVMFPVIGKNGKVNTDAVVYRKKRQQLAIPGDIIYFDRAKDLALVRLKRVPDGTRGLPLAAGDAEPGDVVHVVGNSTFFDGGAFDYCRGTVRNLFYFNTPRVVVAGFAFRDRLFFTLCHDAPTNQGDSGGPVVSDKKELLALVSQGTTGAPGENVQVVDKSIHVREIRRALDGIQPPAGNRLEINGSVDRHGFDSFFVPVKKGSKLSAALKGQGTTDLDLFVKDLDKFRTADFGDKKYKDYAVLAEGVGPTDQEQGEATPTWTGTALVQVQNIGGNGTNKNAYSLILTWADRVPTPFTFVRQLAAGGSDAFKLDYEMGKGKARATVRSDGETALQIDVLDPGGSSVATGKVGTGYHDLRSLTWVPAVSGTYTVRIRNAGGVGCEYVFTTD